MATVPAQLEVSCGEAGCVVRAETGVVTPLQRAVRRPRMLLERFGVQVLGLPDLVDRCQRAVKRVQRDSHVELVVVSDGGLTCYGYSAPGDDRGPAHTRAL